MMNLRNKTNRELYRMINDIDNWKKLGRACAPWYRTIKADIRGEIIRRELKKTMILFYCKWIQEEFKEEAEIYQVVKDEIEDLRNKEKINNG